DTLTINPVSNADIGSYDVVVSNLCASATSAAASLSFSATPQITCPSPIMTNAESGLCVAHVAFAPVASGDPTPTVMCDPTAGTNVGLGTHLITVTVVDAANNTNTCTTSFTVEDRTAPHIDTCAPAVTNSANADCQAQVPIFTNAVAATDNCTSNNALLI